MMSPPTRCCTMLRITSFNRSAPYVVPYGLCVMSLSLPKKSAHHSRDQFGHFSLMGKPLSCNVLFRVDQFAITLYIEDTTTAFDQLNLCIRITCLQFRFHTGSLRKIVSYNTVCNQNVHNAPFLLTVSKNNHRTRKERPAGLCRVPLTRFMCFSGNS